MSHPIPEDAGAYLDEFDGERFWSRVDLHGGMPYLNDPLARLGPDSGECWQWTGGRTGNDRGWYGRLIVFGSSVQAHDLGFRELGGRIAPGLILDHLCRNTLCVRHGHLEPVTPQENLDRGKTGRANRPNCNRGHAFTPENTRWRQRGEQEWRECRTCIRAAKLVT